MNRFAENQTAAWILVLLAFFVAIMSIFIYQNESGAEADMGFLALLGVTIIISLFFYRLHTEVSNGLIRLKFGIGLVSKSILLENVESVTVVRNKWYYGWGIRFFGRGWMWNIGGLDAVELKMKNKKMVFRIGSKQPQKLAEAIQSHIKSN